MNGGIVVDIYVEKFSNFKNIIFIAMNSVHSYKHFFFPCFVQNEKRHMLIQSESEKLKERDERYTGELQDWKDNLVPRKRVSNVLQGVCQVREFREKSGNSLYPLKSQGKVREFSDKSG